MNFLKWVFVTKRLRDFVWHTLVFVLSTFIIIWIVAAIDSDPTWIKSPYEWFMNISVFGLFPAGYIYGLITNRPRKESL